MKRSLLVILCLMVSLCAFPDSASAFNTYRDKETEITAGFGIQGWFSSADAKWQTSFPFVTGTGQPGKVESRLDFRKIGSPVIIMTAGGRIDALFSFDLLYGFGSISGGHGIDTDRFLPSSGGGLEFSQSTSSIDGDVRLWGVNLFYNSKRFGETNKGPWGIVLGILHYEDNLTMKNGVQTVSVPFNGSSFPPLGPFPPTQVLNSTFDFTWNALKAGVTRQDALTKRLSYTGMLAIYPYASYKGEGFWNLRAGDGPNDFRRQSPNFIQKAAWGYGYEATLGMVYGIQENLEFSVGYRYFSLYARNGDDTVYFADGSAAPSTLDWVAVTRHGAYAELMLRF